MPLLRPDSDRSHHAVSEKTWSGWKSLLGSQEIQEKLNLGSNVRSKNGPWVFSRWERFAITDSHSASFTNSSWRQQIKFILRKLFVFSAHLKWECFRRFKGMLRRLSEKSTRAIFITHLVHFPVLPTRSSCRNLLNDEPSQCIWRG